MSTVELFLVTHTKKGSNGELITPKATHMLSRYNDLVVKKYGEGVTSQPELGDVELWTEAVGGVKKGRIYGFGTPYDPQLVMTGIPSTIRSTQLRTSEEVRVLKEELKKRDEELKKRDEQIAEQQRTFEQRCEQWIEEQVQHVAAQMRQMMEQVASFTGGPISFTLSGSSPRVRLHATQMRQTMDQVVRFTSAPISFTPFPPHFYDSVFARGTLYLHCLFVVTCGQI